MMMNKKMVANVFASITVVCVLVFCVSVHAHIPEATSDSVVSRGSRTILAVSKEIVEPTKKISPPRMYLGDDDSLKYFSDYTPAQMENEQSMYKKGAVSVACKDGRKLHTKVLVEGFHNRSFHGGKRMLCNAIIQDHFCETGVVKDTKIMSEITPIYPQLAGPITYKDVKMLRMYKQFDKLKTQWPNYNKIPHNKDVKIAFVILMHQSAPRTKNLVRYLNHPNHMIYIHIDAAAADKLPEMQAFASHYTNVRVSATIQCSYMSISLVYAEMSAYMDLRLDDFAWDYVINLSESDYTFKTLRELRAQVTDLNNSNVILFENVTQHHMQRIYQPYVECNGNLVRMLDHHELYARPHVEGVDLWVKGSQWHVLTRQFVLFMIENQVARSLLFWLRLTKIPDESYLAMLANYVHKHPSTYNMKIINRHSHYTRWEDAAYIITCADLAWLSAPHFTKTEWGGGFFFYRKFRNDKTIQCADDIRATRQRQIKQ